MNDETKKAIEVLEQAWGEKTWNVIEERAFHRLLIEIRDTSEMLEEARDVVFRDGLRIVHGSFRNPPDELWRVFYRDTADTFPTMSDAFKSLKSKS